MGILSTVSRRLRDLSIRHKLILVTALTSSTAILLALGIFLVLDLSSFREALKRDVHVTADIVAPGTSAALAFQDAEEAGRRRASVRLKADTTRAGRQRDSQLLSDEGQLSVVSVQAFVLPERAPRGV